MFAWEAGFSYADLSDKLIFNPKLIFLIKGEVSFADSSYTIHLKVPICDSLYPISSMIIFFQPERVVFSYMAWDKTKLVPKSWYSPFGVGLNVATSAYAGDWIFRFDMIRVCPCSPVTMTWKFQNLSIHLKAHVNGFSLVVCVGFD